MKVPAKLQNISKFSLIRSVIQSSREKIPVYVIKHRLSQKWLRAEEQYIISVIKKMSDPEVNVGFHGL